MRNRVVKQMFMFGMASMLAVSNPVVGWASESETKDETQDGSVVEVTSHLFETPIYKDEKVNVSINSGGLFTPNASDLSFWIGITNEYPNILSYNISDGKIDDTPVQFQNTTGEIQAGHQTSSMIYMPLEEVKASGFNDFKNISYTITGTLDDGTEVFKQDVIMDRSSFKSMGESSAKKEETESKENTEKTEAEKTTEETSNTDIEERLSALEENTKELEEKNKQLEDEKKQLEEKIKQLEEEKNQPSPEPTATPEPTAVPEPTETPEPTVAPEPQPVVEYKDATTIRIVQQTLNDKGYNCGNPDGVAGGNTSKAITQYQTEKGITANGLVTDELLQSLGVVEKVQEAVAAEASKNEYESGYTYDQLARNPDTYMGKKVKLSGKVLQADSDGDTCYARVALNSDYDTVIFVTYDKSLLGYRLLEDDKITIYGSAFGVYSYEAVSGATITIPWVLAHIIEM